MSNRPKPTRLKLIEGTFRKDRVAIREANPMRAVPETPPHLSEEAKAEWDRVSRELHEVGLLSHIDRAALAAYCECWADWVEASRLSQKKVIKTSNGNLVENPYFSVKKRSAELMHKFMVEFGMTPSSRTKINTLLDRPDAKNEDDKNYA